MSNAFWSPFSLPAMDPADGRLARQRDTSIARHMLPHLDYWPQVQEPQKKNKMKKKERREQEIREDRERAVTFAKGGIEGEREGTMASEMELQYEAGEEVLPPRYDTLFPNSSPPISLSTAGETIPPYSRRQSQLGPSSPVFFPASNSTSTQPPDRRASTSSRFSQDSGYASLLSRDRSGKASRDGTQGDSMTAEGLEAQARARGRWRKIAKAFKADPQGSAPSSAYSHPPHSPTTVLSTWQSDSDLAESGHSAYPAYF
ncbi:hypothetical protein JCM11641_000410 [Rhodosporidiobolus odoratus]